MSTLMHPTNPGWATILLHHGTTAHHLDQYWIALPLNPTERCPHLLCNCMTATKVLLYHQDGIFRELSVPILENIVVAHAPKSDSSGIDLTFPCDVVIHRLMPLSTRLLEIPS